MYFSVPLFTQSHAPITQAEMHTCGLSILPLYVPLCGWRVPQLTYPFYH